MLSSHALNYKDFVYSLNEVVYGKSGFGDTVFLKY